MRISDSQFSQIMLQSLQKNKAGLATVFEQMATEQRLTKLSDDPMASVKLLNLEREESALTQYKKNVTNVKSVLEQQEVQLDAMSNSLISMREKVLWGANGSLTDQDRSGMIIELKSYRDAIQSALNHQDEEGHFLFSGTQSNQAAVTKVNNEYTLFGNNDKRVVTVAKGVSIEANITASDLMKRDSGDNVLNQIDALIAEFDKPGPNFQAEVGASLTSIDDMLGNVLEALTEIGGRHTNLDLLDSAHSESSLFINKVSDELSGLDPAEASVRMNKLLTALQATQTSYVKINDLRLFDRI
ncbi:flagellar hook-associated protein FlgL [Vibrio sagamiensis]|uniref:Flagellar hook-associated protein 3 n=1 Tax=Vibrio sagamiensis NBRC 104589 TaxID=1219064 RepID=A0A511QD49_9VIBR|nr:flagellar hook-associated protein FlgL [Vibrio sagamiensis]PNQ66926.1 flagellar hook-associated protein 3 [Vibrio agarivorans]GEM75218.1 flagellar hook-associated protein 3 [Vibrio sagamiensis NBRC 104589]